MQCLFLFLLQEDKSVSHGGSRFRRFQVIIELSAFGLGVTETLYLRTFGGSGAPRSSRLANGTTPAKFLFFSRLKPCYSKKLLSYLNMLWVVNFFDKFLIPIYTSRNFYPKTTSNKDTMKNNTTLQTNYPPPPPQASGSKFSRKMLLAIVVIVVVVVAVVVGAFALMNTGSNPSSPTPNPSHTTSPAPTGSTINNPSTSPSQSGTPQASQTPTPSATLQPSSSAGNTEGVINFRLGAWANYTDKNYDTDGVTVTTETHMKESIGEGSPTEGQYVGRDCWKMISEMDIDIDGALSTSSSVTYYEKSTMKPLRIETISQGFSYGMDINDTGTTDPGTSGAIDPNTVISREACTVPAGTFLNCMKAQITVDNPYTGTIVSLVWVHQDVPIWGIVKSESRTNGVLSSTSELTAYG